MPVVENLVAAAETVVPEGDSTAAWMEPPEVARAGAGPPLRGAPPEEVGLVVRWLTRPGVRIVRTAEGYCEPVHGAARWTAWAEIAENAAATARESEGADYIDASAGTGRTGSRP